VELGATIRFPEGARKRQFWAAYPKDEAAFRRFVIPESYDEEGIVFYPDHVSHRARALQDSYRGMPRQEVARLCFFWRSDLEGFEAKHSPDTMEAIQDFLVDRTQRQKEEKAWRVAEAERCKPPTPPVGYSWRPDFGFIERYELLVDRIPG
jgi:hypothetical protein